jgi:hypothetical protein
MRNDKINICIECNSEVVKLAVKDSKVTRLPYIRNWGTENPDNHQITILPMNKVRYDPRNRCLYHLKKFLRQQALRR